MFSDSLSQNIHNWPVGNFGHQQHVFKDGAYHIANQGNQGAIVVCQRNFPQTTLSYQLTMEEVSGDDAFPADAFGMVLNYNPFCTHLVGK